MKTPMQELKNTIQSMINHGGTEEDLFSVIAHIDNTFLEKEKEHTIDFGFSCSQHVGREVVEEYYNKTYNPKKIIMKIEDVKTIDEAQYYVEGVINDFEGGIITKEETLGLLGEYTAHCMKIWQENVMANPSLLGLKYVIDK